MDEKGSTSRDPSGLAVAQQRLSSETVPTEKDSDLTPRRSVESPDQKPVAAEDLAKDEEGKYLTGAKLGVVTAAVTLVCFLVLLDISIIVTVSILVCFSIVGASHIAQAIPVITTHFHSLEDIGWYGSSYQIARYAT